VYRALAVLIKGARAVSIQPSNQATNLMGKVVLIKIMRAYAIINGGIRECVNGRM